MNAFFKTILVPTDFTDSARSAAHYAAHLSQKTGARLVLLHAFYVPEMVTDVTLLVPSADDMEYTSKTSLKRLKAGIHADYGDEIAVETICVQGGPVEEAERYMKEHRVDLVVMGMKDASYFDERLFGSAATKTMLLANCPVIVVDKDTHFHPIRNIVLACDYTRVQFLHDQLTPLVKLAGLFKAHVQILNVIPQGKPVLTLDEAIASVHLDHALASVDHSFYQIEHEDVVEGIKQFAAERNADLLVMIPREHSLLERVLREPKTKQMAFHAGMPLLTIHE